MIWGYPYFRKHPHASYCWLVGWIMLDELIDNDWNSLQLGFNKNHSSVFSHCRKKNNPLTIHIQSQYISSFWQDGMSSLWVANQSDANAEFPQSPPKKTPRSPRVAGFVFFMVFRGSCFVCLKFLTTQKRCKDPGNQTNTSIETLHCSLQFCLSDHKAFKYVPDSASSHHYRCLPAFQHLLLKAQDDPANSSLSYPTQSLKYLWCGHKTLEIRQFLHMFWSNGPNMEMDNRWWSFSEMPSRRP